MLPGVEIAINTFMRQATGKPPFKLSHCREAILPFNMYLAPTVLNHKTDAEPEAAQASRTPCGKP